MKRIIFVWNVAKNYNIEKCPSLKNILTLKNSFKFIRFKKRFFSFTFCNSSNTEKHALFLAYWRRQSHWISFHAFTTFGGISTNTETITRTTLIHNNNDDRLTWSSKKVAKLLLLLLLLRRTCYCNFSRPIMNAVRYGIDQSYLVCLVNFDRHTKHIPSMSSPVEIKSMRNSVFKYLQKSIG